MPYDQAESDARAATLVSGGLHADPDFFFRHVNVSVHAGVAQLSGFVWSTGALYRAEAIAREAPGVTGVVDQMQLERDGARNGDG